MTKFIAEIGSNHNGNLARALELIDAAAASGCSGVKFQRFRADTLYAPGFTQKVRPEQEIPDTWWKHLRTQTDMFEMSLGTSVFAPMDVSAVMPYVDFLKIASYSVLNRQLLIAVHNRTLPVMVGTGLSTYGDIDAALDILGDGPNVTLLHCVSSYPVKPEHCRLNNIARFKHRWPMVHVGWSDHSQNEGVVIAAAALGAEVIEVHLDLSDRKGRESGGGHCWDFRTLTPVIRMVREGEAALGPASKEDNPAEVDELNWRADPADGLRPMRSVR